jgi:pyruvate dehydrogenase E2 component (dihydrolipoamide acetyltransferase)
MLAVGRVRSVPMVSGGALAAGHRLALTLSCDHRAIDGALGATFLRELEHVLVRPLLALAS